MERKQPVTFPSPAVEESSKRSKTCLSLGLLPPGFPNKNVCAVIIYHACYRPRPFHISSSDQPKNILWWSSLIMEFPQAFYNFLSHKAKIVSLTSCSQSLAVQITSLILQTDFHTHENQLHI